MKFIGLRGLLTHVLVRNYSGAFMIEISIARCSNVVGGFSPLSFGYDDYGSDFGDFEAKKKPPSKPPAPVPNDEKEGPANKDKAPPSSTTTTTNTNTCEGSVQSFVLTLPFGVQVQLSSCTPGR
jgi:hypothetical protein